MVKMYGTAVVIGHSQECVEHNTFKKCKGQNRVVLSVLKRKHI